MSHSANDHQVGGSHYRIGGEQHWDRMWRLYGPGYFVGCITKYVERYQNKNGIQDLEKAKHFIEKLIELEGAKPKVAVPPMPREEVVWDEDARNQLRYDTARNNQHD